LLSVSLSLTHLFHDYDSIQLAKINSWGSSASYSASQGWSPIHCP